MTPTEIRIHITELRREEASLLRALRKVRDTIAQLLAMN